jgi:hypothetical protein
MKFASKGKKEQAGQVGQQKIILKMPRPLSPTKNSQV